MIFIFDIDQASKLNKIFSDGWIVSEASIMEGSVSVLVNEIYISFVPQKLEYWYSNISPLIWLLDIEKGPCLYLCQHTIKTISLFPNAAARCNGVSSPIFVVWTLAPRLINISTIFVWPPLAAQCNGENWWSSLKRLSKGITLTVMFHNTIWLNTFKYNNK